MALPYMKLSTRLERARRASRFLTDEPTQEELDDVSGSDEGGSAIETLLDISCSRTGRSIVVLLRGELDLFSRPHLERELKRVERDGLERLTAVDGVGDQPALM